MDEPMNPAATPTPATGGDTNKLFAILGYIIPILFFVPMLSEEGKKSQFAMFHANQQLLLLITWIVAGVTAFILIGFVIYIFALVLMIMGIVSAAGGTMKKLPLIGGISIIK